MQRGALARFALPFGRSPGHYHLAFDVSHDGETIFAAARDPSGSPVFHVVDVASGDALHSPSVLSFSPWSFSYNPFRDELSAIDGTNNIYNYWPLVHSWSSVPLDSEVASVRRLYIDGNGRYAFLHVKSVLGEDKLLVADTSLNWTIVDEEVLDPSGGGFTDWAYTNAGLPGGRLVLLNSDGAQPATGRSFRQFAIGEGNLIPQPTGPVMCDDCWKIAGGGDGEIIWAFSFNSLRRVTGYDFGVPFGWESAVTTLEVSSYDLVWAIGNSAENAVYAYSARGETAIGLSTNFKEAGNPLLFSTGVLGSPQVSLGGAVVSKSGRFLFASDTFSILGDNKIGFVRASGL